MCFPSSCLKKWLIGLAGVCLVLLAAWAIRFFLIPPSERFPREHFLERSIPMTPEKIQGWMTFEYLNIVFKMPPDYLREKLALQGTAYPRITLRRYAKQTGMDLPLLIQNIQGAIREYQSQ